MTPSAVVLSVLLSSPSFQAGKPIWPEGRTKEKNLFVGFRAVVESPEQNVAAILRVTGSTLYRAFVNGQFLTHGPARACHGYFRVDFLPLKGLLRKGKNTIAIEVAGYNANSYYLLDQPSFLQAEVLIEGQVVAATPNEFECFLLPQRLQRVQRYSFQRPFTEVYQLTPDWTDWRTGGKLPGPSLSCELLEEKSLLPRRVPLPDFRCRPALSQVAEGAVDRVEVKHPWKDRALIGIGDALKGFPEKELEIVQSLEAQSLHTRELEAQSVPLKNKENHVLKPMHFQILDLGTNLTGFIGAEISCEKPSTVYLLFDEILSEGDVNWRRMGCVNVLPLDLAPGDYCFESFEPYTLRYLKLLCLEGEVEVASVFLRELTAPDVWEASFASSQPEINRLFDAGRETLRQNATDVFMDCPSRERAGWLCDSFFTARAAHTVMGHALIERNFVENFLLPERFEHLPEGMLPMCYPSDHPNGTFIPNWALWFVVQLEEYLERSQDRQTVDALKPKISALFGYFEPFRNDSGLLEKLESWVFVEWSAANRFVQDVNYPSNMLYAGALSAAGRLYGEQAWLDQAEAVRAAIREESFDGEFFRDNAVRKGEELEITNNRTEACQYFAFFFDVATPETHPELWKRLVEQFGPDRAETGAFPEIHQANSFVGNMLRFEILSREGKGQQILDESTEYLSYMAERTGTLWENTHDRASCNHGFASHICHTLYRDVLGLYDLDLERRVITLRFTPIDLDWCEGRIPTSEGFISLRWRKEEARRVYRLDRPTGFTVVVEKPEGLELVREP